MVACNRPSAEQVIVPISPTPSLELAATQLANLATRGEPDDPAICAADDTTEFETAPGARPGANWAVIFEYDIAPDWSVGQHEYTLWFEPCPYAGELPDHLSVSFSTTPDTPLRTTPVYFGPLDVTASKNPNSLRLEAIHPAQAAIARLSNIQLTQAEAEVTARECSFWISLDNGPRYRLLPHKPCRY
jgi:hypothetical protein